jgi:tetratricopeptide (TPR) repeat protein
LDRVQRNEVAGGVKLLNWLREGTSSENTEDPYAGNPFVRVWSSDHLDSDPRGIAIAAAAILTQHQRTAPSGISILEQARAAATPEAREGIDLALLKGYELLGDHAHALATATALSERTPRSQRAFLARSFQLLALQRFDEAEDLVQKRLREMPDDIAGLRAAEMSSAARHDYAGAYERELKAVASASSGAQDLNQLAWLTLFYDRAGGPDAESALRAAQTQANAPGILHTLGCIYAELGKTREAREVLLQTMELWNLSEPNSQLWYAFGRLAEDYGETGVALADYAKVTPPKDSATDWDSTYRLAQARVRILTARLSPGDKRSGSNTEVGGAPH